MSKLAESLRLDGAVAIVTGGGSGVGRATAVALAEQGATVAVTELPGRGKLAETLVAELQRQGLQAMALTLDVRASLTIPSAVDAVANRFGRLDILINNAGTQVLKPALELEESEFDDVMDVNLKGAFLCAQAAGGVMVEQGHGAIVNIASQHGVVGNRNRAPYCASKGGLINLTRALAIEWAKHGVRVNAVSPTFVDTGANRDLLASPEFRSEIESVPLGRAATCDEIAAGVVFLASPAAAMITGHNLLIDGGWTAR
jgi:NAD(P)-dependent dehydrogenase (short-subunit alcohol dehydrogenase family)